MSDGTGTQRECITKIINSRVRKVAAAEAESEPVMYDEVLSAASIGGYYWQRHLAG
jgi:hypothetical protein